MTPLQLQENRHSLAQLDCPQRAVRRSHEVCLDLTPQKVLLGICIPTCERDSLIAIFNKILRRQYRMDYCRFLVLQSPELTSLELTVIGINIHHRSCMLWESGYWMIVWLQFQACSLTVVILQHHASWERFVRLITVDRSKLWNIPGRGILEAAMPPFFLGAPYLCNVWNAYCLVSNWNLKRERETMRTT